jgi:ubiquinone/menaquinone biosynthesis C-methylase UbiE
MAAWRRFSPTWEALGRANAFGAVLTHANGQLGSWNSVDFFETGRADAARFAADAIALVPSAPHTRALDFGCGVGRVTRALTEHFDEVVGVDAAASMIDRARALNRDHPCTFVLNQAPDLRGFASASFTAIYSRLVLQHIPPALVRRYIPELVRVLAPGGALMFQLPEMIGVDTREGIGRLPLLGALKRHTPWPVVVAWRRTKCRLSRRDAVSQMTMFGMRREEVEHLVAAAGGRIIDVRPDMGHGCDRAAGFAYWVTR